MLYFRTRQDARNFAKGTKKIIDLFKLQAGLSKRWAVKVV